MAVLLPRANERLIDVGRDGIPRPTPVYYRFWQSIAELAAAAGVTQAQFQSLLIYFGSTDGTLEGLPPYNPGGGIPAGAQIVGGQSVETNGLLSNGVVFINLLNDVDVPAPTTYYGADGTGAKGWFPIADAFTAGIGIDLTVDGAGVTTVALEDTAVVPGSYGDARTIATFTVDAQGRLTAAGTKPVSTFDSTGLVTGGALSINGGDNTKFDLSAGQAIFIDHTNPAEPVQALVPFGPFTAVTVTNIATQLVTYIGIDAGGAIVQSTTPFSNTQRRTVAFVGVVVHSNNTNINAINVIGATARAGVNQLHDLMEALGPLNLAGNVFGPNGANLLLNRSAGRIFKFGANFQASPNDPHVVSLAGATGLTFRYRLSDSTEFADRTTIDPAQYESAPGVLSAMPATPHYCSIQRLTIFQSGLCRIQYGQTVYNSISAAEDAIFSDPFNTETNIAENGIMRAFLIVVRSATALNDTDQARFVPIGKFGSPASGGAALTSAAIIAALGYTPFNESDYHPQTMSRVSLRF